jgi:hypothetical protein
MSHIFISHATADDPFVADLRRALEGLGLPVWVDSRNLRGGSKLRPEIETAIGEARQVIVVLSLQTVNSPWVRREINAALRVEKRRKNEGYRVIPLLLPGMKPAALGNWFDEEPVAVPVEIGPGGLAEALPDILAALGERLPTDVPQAASLRRDVAAVDELILELRSPTMATHDGQRRARATATLVFQPADATRRPIESRSYIFTAPLGPIELGEIRWYLEEYHLWPVGLFRERAERTEAALPGWGKALYDAGLAANAARDALDAWRAAGGADGRRFSVWVDRDLPEGTAAEEQASADEAASALLSLPWELLHDGGGYLLHGRRASHVRRRLPNRKPTERQPLRLPIRILLLAPRPEVDEQGQQVAGYFDHRSSALPLVEAVENLGELAELTVLTPPTLPSLEAELKRAHEAGQPYAVVHFDGHGVYDRQKGLGALLFEKPSHVPGTSEVPGTSRTLHLVHAADLASRMRDYGIPLVFLDACQTAQVEADPTASVAAKLLEEGVTSVVAMSHSVLVETARRFVQAFYAALAEGKRVGQAMLAGQQALAGDPPAGR